jgi:hypothetical protein
MIAVGAKELFEVVVGPRQVRHPVAMEQPRPVAAGDFEEVIYRWSKLSCLVTVASHRSQQSTQPPLHLSLELTWVVEDASGLLDPAISPVDVGPQRSRFCQTSLDDLS